VCNQVAIPVDLTMRYTAIFEQEYQMEAESQQMC